MSKDDSTGKIQWDRLVKKLSPYTVQKGLRYLKHYGLKEFCREWFKEAVYMPFENRKIPVPVGYDGRLTAEYGDYMKPAKAPTMHGGLILEPDVPYTEYLKTRR